MHVDEVSAESDEDENLNEHDADIAAQFYDSLDSSSWVRSDKLFNLDREPLTFIADGGDGSVYQGKTRDGRIVALKQRQRRELNGNWIYPNYYRLEWQTMATICRLWTESNPYVLKNPLCELECGVIIDSVPYIVMPLYEGVLSSWANKCSSKLVDICDLGSCVIDRLPCQSEYDFLRLSLQVIEAIRTLHNNNVMHRDISTSNLCYDIDVNNELSSLHVIDFGWSRPLETLDDEISPPLSKGCYSSWYRPYEIWLDMEYTRAADIYALGCCLFELLWSRPLNFGNTDAEVTHNMRWMAEVQISQKKEWMNLVSSRYSNLATGRCWTPSSNVLNLIVGEDLHSKEPCLRVDPATRPTVNELHSKWLLELQIRDSHA